MIEVEGLGLRALSFGRFRGLGFRVEAWGGGRRGFAV